MEVFQEYKYVMDPHGAVGYLGWNSFVQDKKSNANGIILETAHPSKFKDVVEETLKIQVALPEQLSSIADKSKNSIVLKAEYPIFHQYLMERG